MLEKESQLRQLKMDSLMEFNRKLAEKYQEQGNEKKIWELKEGQGFINQMKDLETQSLDLGKELLLAREKYDYQTANEIRKKQRDLRDKQSDLMNKTNDRERQIEGKPPSLDEHNL
jgi:hypothetical protein